MRGVDIFYERCLHSEAHMIEFRLKTVNADNPEIPFYTHTAIRLHGQLEGTDSKYVIGCVRDAIKRMYDHEVDEFFKVDGKAIFNPHRGGTNDNVLA